MARKRRSFTTMKLPRDMSKEIDSMKLYPREPKWDVLRRMMNKSAKEMK